MSIYRNYEARNNVKSELYAPISSLATTIQVASGQGERRGNTFPMLATLENIDTSGVVQKREIVLITARSGDTLTVTRKFAPCLASDNANSQGATSFSFDIGDSISNYIAKEYLDKINEAIDDIYDNGDERIKLLPTGGLNFEITDGNVRVGSEEFYFTGGNGTLTNNATNYVMLDGAGQIFVDTTGRNQQYVKVATVETEDGEITDIHQWKMDAIGGVLGGAAGFKNISNTQYKGGQLIYFVADGEAFNLSYKDGKLSRIVSGEKIYTINYKDGRLISAQEN